MRRVRTDDGSDEEDYWDGKTVLENRPAPKKVLAASKNLPPIGTEQTSTHDESLEPLIQVPRSSQLPRDLITEPAMKKDWEKLLDWLYSLALKYDGLWDAAIHPATDVEHLALHHVYAVDARDKIHETFMLMMELPYDATCKLESLLCFLAQADIPNRWKAAQLKMGLFLANEIGRLAWYILVSGFLYTFEKIVKLRKERAR